MTSFPLPGLLLAISMGALSACTPPEQQAAATLIGDASASLVQVDPGVSPVIETTCSAVTDGLDLAALNAKGAAVETVARNRGLAHAACDTPEAKAQLTANDAARIQPDGGSAPWLTGLLTAAKIAVEIAAVAG